MLLTKQRKQKGKLIKLGVLTLDSYLFLSYYCIEVNLSVEHYCPMRKVLRTKVLNKLVGTLYFGR